MKTTYFSKKRRRILPIVLSLVGGLGLLASLFALNQPAQVSANSGDLGSAVNKYPAMNGTRIDSCSLCHTSNVPSLNPYGSAYKSKGRNSAAFAAIESLDSDGDGFTNLQEIQALTFPGNKSDKPAAAPTATKTAAPTSAPTQAPTNPPAPTATATQPPAVPTDTPTSAPTEPPVPPTVEPTSAPTLPPTEAPTAAPTTPAEVTPTAAPTTPPEPEPTSPPPVPPEPGPSGSIIFKPVADSYVNQDRPDTNFGGNKSIRVDREPRLRSYLRFDITGLNGAGIESAVLKIYANSSSDKGFEVRRVDDTGWGEGKIMYKNAPKAQGVIGKSRGFKEGKWISIDITKTVKGEGALSLALVSPDETQTNLAARESGDHSPQLVITLKDAGANPPPTQPAPEPTATATQPPAPTQEPTQPAPEPTATAPAPEPTATVPPVEPTATAPAPEPTATQPAPEPTATQPAPLPTTTQPAPTAVPTATQPAPQPTATVPAPQPPAGCSAVTLPKGPTLILTGDNTQMRVFWQWSANAAFTVEWGTSPAYGASAAVAAKDPTNHLYQTDLSGLTPGAKYYYRVVTGSQCATGSFTAAPPATASALKFFAYGDTRTNGSTHNGLAGQVDAAFAADPALQTFNLNVGDWVSGDSEGAWTGEYFNPSYTHIRQQDANIADIGVRGNHESGATYWKRYWPEPFQSGGLYWSFDYGPLHVVMLDQYTSYSPGSAQYTWLKADLAASAKPWKVVVLHEPGWSASGGHANNTAVQQNLQPLFAQYGVALVLGGHNHYYARASVSGVTHLTMGGGGAPAYSPASGQPNIVKTYKGTSFGQFAIAGNTLSAQILSASGAVVDSFTITR